MVLPFQTDVNHHSAHAAIRFFQLNRSVLWMDMNELFWRAKQAVASEPIDWSRSISFESITTEIRVGQKLFAIVDCWTRAENGYALVSLNEKKCSPIHKSVFLVIKSVSSCNINIAKPPRAPTLLNNKKKTDGIEFGDHLKSADCNRYIFYCSHVTRICDQRQKRQKVTLLQT